MPKQPPFKTTASTCSCDECRLKRLHAANTKGTKTQFRANAQGHVCCREDDPCAAHNGNSDTATLRTTQHEEEPPMTYAPPDPYQGVATLKAASAAPESTFEDRWKADRLQALDAERARSDAANAAVPRLKVLTAEELAPYAAPNGYDIALRARKLMEGR
jgi:hypothetical protein